jgi:hypothetical protein
MADQDNKAAEIVSTPERGSERGQRDRGRRRHRPSQPRHLEQSVNMNELRELVTLITDNGLTLLELEREGFHIKIGRGPFISEDAANALTAANERQIAAPLPGSAPVQSIPTSAASHPGAQAEEAASPDQIAHRRDVLSRSLTCHGQLRAHWQPCRGVDGRLHHRSNEVDERDSG